jgi:hypothetical protein
VTLTVRVESTYTRRLPQLERLVALAREKGMTDDADVTVTNDRTVVISEVQPEADQ